MPMESTKPHMQQMVTTTWTFPIDQPKNHQPQHSIANTKLCKKKASILFITISQTKLLWLWQQYRLVFNTQHRLEPSI